MCTAFPEFDTKILQTFYHKCMKSHLAELQMDTQVYLKTKDVIRL